MGEIGDVAFANAVAVAVGLAEVDGLVNLAVGGGQGGAGDVHVHIIRQNNKKYKGQQGNIACLHFGGESYRKLMVLKHLAQKQEGNIRSNERSAAFSKTNRSILKVSDLSCIAL